MAPVPLRPLPSPSQLAHRALASRSRLERAAASAYPTMPRTAVEDAFSTLLLDIVVHPERYHEAELQGTFEALCRVVVRRALRGEWRLKITHASGLSPTDGDPAEPRDAAPTPEERLARARAPELTAALLQRAARHVCRRRADPLADAMMELLATDTTAVEVAARHELPREYLSLCLTWLRSSGGAAVDDLRRMVA